MFSRNMKPEYVSIDDLATVFPETEQAQATDDSDSRKNIVRNDEIVKEHLRFAESKVESYLLEYDLPFDTPPHSIRWSVLVIAAYMLMLRGDLSTSDNVQEMYNNVIGWLEMVRKGEASLPGLQTTDEDFVGFGTRKNMQYEYFPYQDFQSNYII